MKTLLNIVTLSLTFCSTSFPQFYADSVTPDYIIEFMNIADDFAKQNDPDTGERKFFSDDEIEHIAELYFKCYNDDPVGFQKFIYEKHQQWEKAPLEVTSGKIRMRPWLKVYALKDMIRYKYGNMFTEVIGCPAFIRARYDSVFHSSIRISELNTKWTVNNYVFLIEEVLKGDKFFKSEDHCTITYSPNSEAPVPEIEKGKSYLIPITVRVESSGYSGEVYFGPLRESYENLTMGKPPKTFPIENEIIKNLEYFGLKDTSWTDFKKYFKESYLIFQ